MNEFLGFRKMITPVVIQIVFWIGVAVSVIFGIGLMIAGAAASAEMNRYGGGGSGFPGGLMVFAGLVEMFVGPVLVRISCELTMVFFRIYETLAEIRDDGRGRVPAPAQTYPQTNAVYTHP